MKLKQKKIVIFSISILMVVLITFLICFFCIHVPNIKKTKEQQRLIKEYYDNKLSLYQEENEKYKDYEVDVAFLGDSLTDGYNLEEYYPNYVVSNRGIGGETTQGLEDRLKVSVYDLKPKVVVMLIGGNNLKTMFDNYEDILIGLRDNLPNTKVILLSLTAMGQDWVYKNEIACLNNVKINLLAQKYGYTFVDLFTPLFDIDKNKIYSDYTTDGVHFTSKGYEVVTSLIAPVLENFLED